MSINTDKIANIDINFAAVILMLGVLVAVLRKKHTGNKADTAYLFMVASTLFLATDGLLVAFLRGPYHPGPYVLVMILETLLEVSLNLTMLIWFLYTFFVMYDSMDYLKRKLVLYFAPVVVLLVLDIVNIFTGMLWYYDSNTVYHDTGLYVLQDVFRYAYLFMSTYQYLRYKKETGGMPFFSIWPFIVPMLWGTLLETLTGCTAFHLGISIGVAMLYFISADKSSFIDEVSGFYNVNYLKDLHKRVINREAEPSGILRVELPAASDIAGFCEGFGKVLPEKSETVRTGEDCFVTFLYGNARGIINMLLADIDTIAGEHNMKITAGSSSKEKNETSAEFFERNMGELLRQ
ncbi:MAG: hypothetical protein IJ058_03385 [Lachnospiraceae bacterium]|nr:hypothetical protein [Lachnospiraceae bacterium]